MRRRFHFGPEYEIPELWWEIASYCTPQTLRSLSLVNKKLVDPAQRHLFKELSLKIGLSKYYCQEDYAGSTGERLQNLAKSHLRHYVRRWTCEVFSWSAGYPPPSTLIDAATTLIPLLMQTLPQYTILQSLHLQHMDIDTTTMATLATLKNLKSLHFVFVTFDFQLVLPSSLPLRELLICTDPGDMIHDDVHAQFESFLSPNHLRKLSMECPHYDTLQETLCRKLITHKPHNDFDYLAFSISSLGAVTTFAELLQASPLLQVLKVTMVLTPGNDLILLDLYEAMKSIPLSSNACRLVDDLTSAPTFACGFCPGRPIRKFSMQCDGRILTELKFDNTTTDDARVILPALAGIFPNLKVLCMPINEAEEEVLSHRLGQTLFVDDMEIENSDDIKRERKQFEACYDDGYDEIDILPDTQVSFCDGYLRLLSDIALGMMMELPKTLVQLDIPQNRTHKHLKFTKDHELQLVHFFTTRSRAWDNLRSLKIGMNNVYNRPWKKDSEGRWKKERYYFRDNYQNMVGTACLGNRPGGSDSAWYCLSRGFAVDVTKV